MLSQLQIRRIYEAITSWPSFHQVEVFTGRAMFEEVVIVEVRLGTTHGQLVIDKPIRVIEVHAILDETLATIRARDAFKKTRPIFLN